MTDRRPAQVVHPGKHLIEEIWCRNWTIRIFAEMIGEPVENIVNLIHGDLMMSPDLSEKISQALGTSAELWINLQTNYDKWKGEK